MGQHCSMFSVHWDVSLHIYIYINTNMIHLTTWDITMKQWCPRCHKITLQLSNCSWGYLFHQIHTGLAPSPECIKRAAYASMPSHKG